jgi:hypothetical protein
MTPIEIHRVTPEEMVAEIETSVRKYKEDKYAFQTGLKDLDFEVNPDLLAVHGLSIPFPSIAQAEKALAAGAIQPKEFIEYDDTHHQVLAFDPRPVGYSGFMDCVTHSLALTDLGLFEVGRYPAVNLNAANRFWQWFLHRRLSSAGEVFDWQAAHDLTAEQFLHTMYSALTGLE